MNNKKESTAQCACECDNNKIFISNDMIGSLVACLLIIMFAFLVIGFWAGRWVTLQQFTNQMQEEQFSDGIESAFYSGNASVEQSAMGDEVAVEENDPENSQQTLSDELNALSDGEQNSDDVGQGVKRDNIRYYAELAGFKSLASAKKFENRLINKQINVYTKKRYSKDVKGKEHIWYQVVTHPYASSEELEKIVSEISQQERLKGKIPLLKYTQE